MQVIQPFVIFALIVKYSPWSLYKSFCRPAGSNGSGKVETAKLKNPHS